MRSLRVDSGVQTFRIPGGGYLRFNPADPGLFLRLERLESKARELDLSDPVEADRQIKELLGWALGTGNDVDKALGGVSVFASGFNGKTVLENFLEALMPVLTEGAEQCAETC